MNTQYILVVAIIVLMGWFALGVIFNLRRGDALLKWMQKGLPKIGQRTTFRWLGTSVAELVIANARSPFRRLETLLVLKPRDVFWMTILANFQGRDDILIFRAHLSTPPPLDLELVDPKTWSGRNALKQVMERRWESRDYHGVQLLAPRGYLNLAAQTLDRLAAPIQKLSMRYARISLRKNAPNLELHLPFPDYRTLDASQYFEALRDLARAVGERD
ncbi:MAG TPA: hypothetical protein VNK49_10285 [Anaerolineales bacterium]|nr:hypothetical protein [Anaerolineales bacterium]